MPEHCEGTIAIQPPTGSPPTATLLTCVGTSSGLCDADHGVLLDEDWLCPSDIRVLVTPDALAGPALNLGIDLDADGQPISATAVISGGGDQGPGQNRLPIDGYISFNEVGSDLVSGRITLTFEGLMVSGDFRATRP